MLQKSDSVFWPKIDGCSKVDQKLEAENPGKEGSKPSRREMSGPEKRGGAGELKQRRQQKERKQIIRKGATKWTRPNGQDQVDKTKWTRPNGQDQMDKTKWTRQKLLKL